MNTLEHSRAEKKIDFRPVSGIILILAGGMLFLDRYLKTGWLSLVILPAIGVFFSLWGIRLRRVGMILAGGLLGGAGAGSIAAWGPSVHLDLLNGVGVSASPHPLITQIGLLLFYTGIGWGLFVVTALAISGRPVWWGLIPGGALGGLGACLLFTPIRWEDFVLYLALGVGAPLLFWGLVSRLFGLVIPGCLLVSAGAGIYIAWQTPSLGNTLVQTGVMLISFAAGWILITVGGRIIAHKYVWWPLIPGGILAMTGMGLYIGGDPSHALGFITNTGSIALMIFGLYLLLMRKSIHH